MKGIIGVLVLVVLFQFGTMAQSLNYSFTFRGVPLTEALAEIAITANIDFVYVSEAIPNHIVSGQWVGVSVEHILDDILSNTPLQYQRSGQRTITLFLQRSLTKPFQIFGQTFDLENGEVLSGANIYTDQYQGVVSDNYGLYSLQIDPRRDSILIYSYIGYETQILPIANLASGRRNIYLESDYNLLDPITITHSIKSGGEILEILPQQNALASPTYNLSKSVSGNVDAIEYLNGIPGVVKMSEGRNGISVHGSATDQNLILIDDAPIFNPSHALGFLSVFNNEVLNSVSFYKNDIAPRFGGRLSSVLDVRMREGNPQNYEGTFETNVFYSGLTLEGPVLKDKMSFLFSGRRSHLNYLLNGFEARSQFYVPEKIDFYDLHGKINYKLGDNHQFYLSSFVNNDAIIPRKNPNEILFYDTKWQNRTLTLRWNAIWGEKLFTKTSLVFSDYEYIKSSVAESTGQQYEERSEISNFPINFELVYHFDNTHKISAGFNYADYTFSPASGSITIPEDDFSLTYAIDEIKSKSLAFYLEDDIKLGNTVNLNLGVRYSRFLDIGNDTYEYNYDENGSIIDSTFRRKNETIRTFDNLEPRMSMDVEIMPDLTLKGSWTHTSQFIVRLLNDNPTTPNEYWIPAGNQVEPLRSAIYSLTLRWDANPHSTISLGGFSRNSQNITAFKSGANIFFAESLIDRQITQGDFRSRGLEFSIIKHKPEFHYLLSYTFTSAKVKFDEIDNGNEFNAQQNYTHDLNIQATYNISSKLNAGFNLQWRSGDLITIPSGFNYVSGFPIEVYNQRNNFRLPNYLRLDISSNWEVWKRDRFKLELSPGIYNVTGQLNAFQVSISPGATLPRMETLALVRTVPFLHAKLNFK